MKWLLSIFIVLINYLFIFFAVPLMYNLFVERLSIIHMSALFMLVHFLDAIFVLFLYVVFNKYHKQSDLERDNGENIGLLNLVVIVILPTIVFLLYKYLIGEISLYNFNIKEFLLNQLVYITFIPFAEELVFREILYKLLIKYNIFIVSVFISVLFTIIHIGLGGIDPIYLLYIFINGLALFYIRYKKSLPYAMDGHAMINMVMIFFT